MPSQPTYDSGRRGGGGAAGFTLIELLVVGVLLALVITTIGACLSAGLRVWDVARTFNRGEADATLALDLMARDLCNVLPFEAIAFEGQPDALAFAGTVRSGAEGRLELGTIAYTLTGQALRRRETPYPEGSGRAEDLADAVLDLRFSYMTGEDETVSATTNLPRAVRVELTVDDGQGPVALRRTVALPTVPR